MQRRRLVTLLSGVSAHQRVASRDFTSTPSTRASVAEAEASVESVPSSTSAALTPQAAGTVARRAVLSRLLERAADALANSTAALDGTASDAMSSTVLGVSCPPTRSSSVPTTPSGSPDVSRHRDRQRDEVKKVDDIKVALDLFAQTFSATMHVIEQHPHAHVLARASSPPACNTPAAPLESVTVAAAALSLGPARQAHALERLTEAQQLVLACIALCRRVWRHEQAQSNESGALATSASQPQHLAARVTSALMEATSRAAKPTGVELSYRRRALRQHLRQRLGSEEEAERLLTGRDEENEGSEHVHVKTRKNLKAMVRRALFSGACDTSTSLLGRTTLELFLARALLAHADACVGGVDDDVDAAGVDMEKVFLRQVAHAMLVTITTRTYRLDRISARDGVRTQSFHGLDAFLRTQLSHLDEEHSKLHRQISTADEWPSAVEGDAETGRQDHRRYRAVVRSHLRACLALYAGALPELVTAAVMADAAHASAERPGAARGDVTRIEAVEQEVGETANGGGDGGAAGRASTHLVQVLETLKYGWRRGAGKVRIEGPSPAALWWLQTAAVTMDAFAACATRSIQLAADTGRKIDTNAHNSDHESPDMPGAAAEAELLTRIQAELSTLLHDFFHYDRVIFSHYQRLTQMSSSDASSDARAPAHERSSHRRGRRSLFQIEPPSTDTSHGLGAVGSGTGSNALITTTSATRRDGSGHGDGSDSVLRPVAKVSESLGDARRRGASRFVARNRALLQDGIRVTGATTAEALSAAAAAAAAATASKKSRRGRKRKSSAAADAEGNEPPSVSETEEAFSALFHIFALLRTSPGSLASRYSITLDRTSELEETWLTVLRAMLRLESVVLGPPPAHEAFLEQQRRTRFRQTAATIIAANEQKTVKLTAADGKRKRVKSSAHAEGAAQPSSEFVNRLVDALQPSAADKKLPRSVLTALDAVRYRLLTDALAAATTATTTAPWEDQLHRAQQAALVALDRVVQAVPRTTLDSALLITNRMTEALLLVVDRSEDLSASRSPFHRQAGVASRYRTTLQMHRRSLLTALTMGAQEVVLGNGALANGVIATWWFKTLPWSSSSGTEAVLHAARTLGFSRRLGTATAALQSRHRLLSIDERLDKVEEAVGCLEKSVVRDGRSDVCVDLAARQALVAGALSQLITVGRELRAMGGLSGWSATAAVDVRHSDSAAARKRASQAYRRLTALLHADGELVLLSSFAAGLRAWHDASRLFARELGDASAAASEVPAEKIAAAFLPLTLSAIIASLDLSRQHDDPSTHASLCEHALLILSALCEHAAAMATRDAVAAMTGRQAHSPSAASACPSTHDSAVWERWRTALAQICTYCLGWSLRDTGSVHNTAADRAAMFVALYTHYSLPLGEVAWREELDRRLPRASPLRLFVFVPPEPARTRGYPSAYSPPQDVCAGGGFLLFLDHSSRLLLADYHCRPYHTTVQERSVEALREFQHALHTTTDFDVLDGLDREDGSGATAAATASVKARVQAQQRRARAWFALRASLAHRAGPLATFEVADVTQSHALHPLVRFMESHASLQLHRCTQLQLGSATADTPHTAAPARPGEAAVALDVHSSAMLLLRFIGDLHLSHSWVMLCAAFRVAQLAHRAETILGARETIPLRVAGLSTVLGLLQAMPTPRRSVRLRTSFLTVLQRLTDMLSASSTTLLGMRNGAAVRGWLARPNRDVYRGAMFGVKQTVLYVQREATWFCDDAATALVAAEAEEREADADTETENAAHALGDGGRPPATVRAPYYTAAYRDSRDAMSLEKEFVRFVAILRSALELVLECVRHHALQQRVIDGELTSVLTTCYDVLCQLFCDATRTVLREKASNGKMGASFADEHAELFLAGLSLVASVNVVQQHDPAGIFFHGRALSQTKAVLSAVEALLDATPTVHEALQTAFARFITSGFYTRDLSWRLGTILYGRTDVTALVVALSTFADTALRQPAAAQLYGKAWYRLQGELLQRASDIGAHEAASQNLKKQRAPRAKKAQRGASDASVKKVAFRVPSRQEFVLAASAFNELHARYHQTHSDAQSLEGGVGVFTPGRNAEARAAQTHEMTTPPPAAAATRAALLDWSCDTAQLAAAVIEAPALSTHADTLTDPNYTIKNVEEEETEDVYGSGADVATDAARPTSAAHTGRVGFVFNAYIDVADAAAEGVLTAEEIIGSVIQQSRDLGLVSGALISHDATASDGTSVVVNGMTPQVRVAMESYLHNLVALLELYPLSQVCTHPAGAAPLFRLLEPWLALRETSELARSAHGTTTKLWRLLADKVRTEAVAPHEHEFSAYQAQLLQAVYRLRTTQRDATAATPSATSRAGETDIFHVPGWFSSAAREAATALWVSEDEAELSCSDDVRSLLPDNTSSSSSSSPVVYTTHDAIRTPVFPSVIPLEVTMVLLRALLRGDRRVPQVRDLADGVAAYAARQFVLLRTRLDGSAVNILGVLLAEPGVRAAVLGGLHEENNKTSGGSTTIGKNGYSCAAQSRLWLTLGLPTRSVHSSRVRDALFTAEKRGTLEAVFAAAGLDVQKDAGGSVEQAVFEYMRATALYARLLSTIASVLLRYKLYGDLVEDSVRALFFSKSVAHLNQAGVYLGDDDGNGHFTGAKGQTRESEEVPIEHPLRRQLRRQTEPSLVNRNLFESVMLHYLNVSVAMTHHADALYHVAADRVLALAEKPLAHTSVDAHVADADGDGLMAYAEEVRHLAADALQGTLATLGFLAGRTNLTHVRCAAHQLISTCSCDPLALPRAFEAFTRAHPTLSGPAATRAFTARQGRLAVLRQQHPAVEVGSPTMLAVLTPSYFERSLTYTMPRAQSTAVTPIAASFCFYMQQRHVALAPLLAAVAELLASTVVRNSAQKMLCEKLARALLQRPDFRLALAPPTVASGSSSVESLRGGLGTGGRPPLGGVDGDAVHGSGGRFEPGHSSGGSPSTGGAPSSPAGVVSALPNEVLIPFLAAMTRGDVQITKSTLAELLHTVMRMRVDVFGEPPIAARQAKLSLVGGGGVQHVGGSFDIANPLYAQRPSPAATSQPGAGHGDHALAVTADPLTSHVRTDSEEEEEERVAAAQRSQKDLALLEGFSASGSSDSASATHRRALASLNLSLPAAMEVAMHLGASRHLTKSESVRARSLLKAADDARRERVGAYRSIIHAAAAGGHARPDDATPVQPVLDATLHIEDPTDYGVAILHVQFALRKVVHAAFRRLGPHQTPASLAMMTDMLYAIDPSFRVRREKDPARGAQPSGSGGSGAPSHTLPEFPLDPMLTGTIRILLARARLSAHAVGYGPNGAPQRYLTASSATDDASSLSGSTTPPGTSQPVLFPLTTISATTAIQAKKKHKNKSTPDDTVAGATDGLASFESDTHSPQALRLRQTLEEEAGVSVALTTSVMPASAKMKMRQAVRAALRQSRSALSMRRKLQQRRVNRTQTQ